MSDSITQRWANLFGLAIAPLFEGSESHDPNAHSVLLDGGLGSFAISVTEEPLWRSRDPAEWAWSSNLPHHVTVTEKVVAVNRWDAAKAEEFSRQSVESQAESFYAYLAADRVRSTQGVVDHALRMFRNVRSLVSSAGMPDNRSVDVFLAFLDSLIAKDRGGHESLVDDAGAQLLRSLPPRAVNALVEDAESRNSFQSLRLRPSLAVRHAGSDIFQEAHFELIRVPSEQDMFGYIGPASAKPISRGGAHFTPPALARIVTEQTLSEVHNLTKRPVLTILDPACGSGAFLQEAVRTLRRLGYSGRLRIVGRDISDAATSMAKFVVGHALADWRRIGDTVDIKTADSLEDSLPEADVVLMNPPFVSWSSLTSKQRSQMKAILQNRLQGRGDLSMAFVTRALELVKEGGAIGTLLPSSLLALRAAEQWRTDLLERSDLRLLASLGDYGLFAHALVQVAAAVFAKPERSETRRGKTKALVSTNSADATGNALRMLRKSQGMEDSFSSDGSWRIFSIPTSDLSKRPAWLLTSPKTDAALTRLFASGAVRLDEMFEVRQGIRTGDNKAFLLDEGAVKDLPPRERRYFRRAAMNDSIGDGRVQETYWVFYPYGEPGIALKDEETLRKAVPTYLERHLEPRRRLLEKRSSIQTGLHWWDLSRSRVSWALDQRPRLISKYFGRPGGFALDLKAELVVVQGFAWIPKWIEQSDDEETIALLTDSLCAYAALMNSNPFEKMLALHSPHVAGGQYDLSPRYTINIPVPNLVELGRNQRAGRLVAELAKLGRNPRITDRDWVLMAERLTIELYGGDFFKQI